MTVPEEFRTDNGYTNACCAANGTQPAQINLPVRIEPKATLGCPAMKCVGQPEVQCVLKECGCEITVTQCVAICLPIEYSLVAKTGETTICCKDPCC